MKSKYSVTEINENIKNDAKSYISQCVGEYQDKICRTTEKILSNSDFDIVMLAGPSSSGKTTTANKIKEEIKRKGQNASIISLDDFYFDRGDIPINSDGLPDYENITALDLKLIKEVFNTLINERTAVVPVFDFNQGKREEKGRELHIGKDDVVIVEGIHALNPIITEGIDPDHLYKVYLNVSSRITDENGGVLLTKRDLRFVRRVIRDYNFRSSSVENTYFLWSGVRKGEDRFIFPFKSQADEFINSIHPFEPCLFRDDALKLLESVEKESPYYDEALRLSEAMHKFESADKNLLPEDSLLREFIG